MTDLTRAWADVAGTDAQDDFRERATSGADWFRGGKRKAVLSGESHKNGNSEVEKVASQQKKPEVPNHVVELRNNLRNLCPDGVITDATYSVLPELPAQVLNQSIDGDVFLNAFQTADAAYINRLISASRK